MGCAGGGAGGPASGPVAWRDSSVLVTVLIRPRPRLAGRAPGGHAYSWQSALAIALAGLLSAAVEVPPRSRQFIPLLIGGVWLLAHGVPTLVRYLRTDPAPKAAGA